MYAKRYTIMRGHVIILILTAILSLANSTFAEDRGWNELNSQTMNLYLQGNYVQAAKLGEESLKSAEKTFGPEHPNVAKALNNLGLIYKTQGKYAQAEQLYNRSMAIK